MAKTGNIANIRSNPLWEQKRRDGIARYWERYRAEKGLTPAQNGHKPDVYEAIGELTAEQIVGAIQQRIDDLTNEVAVLRGEHGRLVDEAADLRRADAARQALFEEVRLLKEARDRDVFELQKENRQLAAELRAAKEKHGGLRLFGNGSRSA